MTWSHYIELLKIKNDAEILYYINQSIKLNLSRNELRNIIKNKEYERLPQETKNELINEKDNNLKKSNMNNTIGIIISKRDNRYVIEYCSDRRIVSREYILV